MGAYDPYGLTIPLNTQSHVLGGYDILNYHSDLKVVFTNKTLTTPIRGAGRPQGIYVIERMMDIAARQLGMDPLEIRKRNLIPADAFPYERKIIDQAFAPLILDSGNYKPVLEKAAQMIGYEQFVKEEGPRLRAAGRHVGIGLVAFIETTGVGPYEGARVTVEASGKISCGDGRWNAGTRSLYFLCPDCR